ncbi:unnamed protein product [Moneuplotes crassus]|uniref:Secreted protein n=1 Tax=Euplotes crassus TaxID=5936 RepID=A0AAD1XQ48_EUPCR|nr:unnamed protein product [Moneuplotes crassus]
MIMNFQCINTLLCLLTFISMPSVRNCSEYFSRLLHCHLSVITCSFFGSPMLDYIAKQTRTDDSLPNAVVTDLDSVLGTQQAHLKCFFNILRVVKIKTAEHDIRLDLCLIIRNIVLWRFLD